jgi:hypothetical protein
MKFKIVMGILFLFVLHCAPAAVQKPAEEPVEEEGVVIIGEEEVEEEAPVVGEEEPAEEVPIVEEVEEAPVVEEEVPEVEEGEVAAVPAPEEEVPAPPAGKVFGYRVQILALDASKPGSKEKAEKYAKQAENALRGEYKVYVEYIPPYYKVRVGDFLSRAEAEKMKMKLRAIGYFDAWIVETEINPPK